MKFFKKSKPIIFVLLLLFVPYLLQAQNDYTPRNESCTSIMVGKNASTDGSVITSHTCDGRYRTWLNIVPARTYATDTVRPVYWGLLHTETPDDRRNVEQKGTIPQVKQTFAFLNTAYPCLNEKQLGMGETTITGRKELYNENGLFLIEELQAIALERCSTARDAIMLIGSLVKQYGYGDYGECITIADKKEVWQLEIFGEGADKIGSVWAAQRIPDEHVGISANISRISMIDTKDKDHFLYSENVFDVAKKMGFWDGKEPFKFWKAYGDTEKAFNIREFFVLSTLAPSLNLVYDVEELPFSVKPEKKVSVQDIIAFYRQTYEGTPYDMTKNLVSSIKQWNPETEEYEVVDTAVSAIANAWMGREERDLYNFLNPNSVTFYRTVAVSWCSYSHIIQLRDWLPDAVGGIAWFSFDNPAESPRIPIFAGTTTLPKLFNVCGQKSFREDAAIWKYRKANKLATVKWAKGRVDIEKAVADFENKAFAEMPYVEKTVQEMMNNGGDYNKFLTDYTHNFAFATMTKWEELERLFWQYFGLGF